MQLKEFDRKVFNEEARKLRYKIMEMIGKAGSGHVGGCLSVVEILLTLYHRVMRIDPKNPGWEERDRFVMSKGHAGPALYATLANLGYFPVAELDTLNANGTNLPSHCDRLRTVGIDMTTGSLGQGLSAAVGIGIGMKLKKLDSKVWCMIGCGESAEGQNWEAAMAASKFKLDNLVALTDYNRLQIDGDNNEVMPLEPIVDKWRAFGWETFEVDGHDWDKLYATMKDAEAINGKPAMIIAHTIKGKGLSYAEGQVSSHNIKMTPELTAQALDELSAEKYCASCK